jgi:Na+/melibiose symporter-like transporter
MGVVLTYVGFINYPAWFPIHALFIGFMVAMGIRNVSYNTLTSRVPEPAVRARFMSLQSAISHMASALASAVLAPLLLTTRADESLAGMGQVAGISILLALSVPPMLFLVERRVRARTAEQAAALPPGGAGLAPRTSSHH